VGLRGSLCILRSWVLMSGVLGRCCGLRFVGAACWGWRSNCVARTTSATRRGPRLSAGTCARSCAGAAARGWLQPRLQRLERLRLRKAVALRRPSTIQHVAIEYLRASRQAPHLRSREEVQCVWCWRGNPQKPSESRELGLWRRRRRLPKNAHSQSNTRSPRGNFESRLLVVFYDDVRFADSCMAWRLRLCNTARLSQKGRSLNQHVVS
jgi:hypothetical protein